MATVVAELAGRLTLDAKQFLAAIERAKKAQQSLSASLGKAAKDSGAVQVKAAKDSEAAILKAAQSRYAASKKLADQHRNMRIKAAQAAAAAEKKASQNAHKAIQSSIGRMQRNESNVIIASQKRKVAAAEKAAKEQIAAANRVAKEQASAANKAAKEAERTARLIAKAAEKAYKDEAAAVQRAAKQEIADRTRVAKEAYRLAQQTARAKEKAAKEEAAAVSRVMKQESADRAKASRDAESAMQSTQRSLMILGAAILGVGVKSFKMFADFESSITKMAALAGQSKDDLAVLTEGAMGISSEAARGPKEIADALYYVTSSGYDAASALSVVDMTAKAATSGLGDTATITSAVVSVLNAYGMEASSAASVTDQLTAAVRYGSMEADELAPSLGRVTPIASRLGVTFDELAGYMSVLSLAGLNSAESSTALKSAFTQIISPSHAALGVLEALETSFGGLSTSQDELVSAVGDKGLLPVLRELWDSVGGNISQFQLFFPEVRGLAGALSLLGQDAEKVDTIMSGVHDSTGVVDDAFEIMAETSAYKLQQAIVAIQQAAIELGGRLAPVVSYLVDGVKAFADAWKAIPEAMKSALGGVAGIVGIAVAIAGVTFAITKTILAIKEMAVAFKLLAVGNPVLMGMVAITTVLTALFIKGAQARSKQAEAEREYADALALSSTESFESIRATQMAILNESDLLNTLVKVQGSLGIGSTGADLWTRAIMGSTEAAKQLRAGILSIIEARQKEMQYTDSAGKAYEADDFLDTDSLARLYAVNDAGLKNALELYDQLAESTDTASGGAKLYATEVAVGLRDVEEAHRKLNEQLDDGVISQAQYDAGMEAATVSAGDFVQVSEAVAKVGLTEDDLGIRSINAVKEALDAASTSTQNFVDKFTYAFGGPMEKALKAIDVRDAVTDLRELLEVGKDETAPTADEIFGGYADAFSSIQDFSGAAGASNEEVAYMVALLTQATEEAGATETEVLKIFGTFLDLKNLGDLDPFINDKGMIDYNALMQAVKDKLVDVDNLGIADKEANVKVKYATQIMPTPWDTNADGQPDSLENAFKILPTPWDLNADNVPDWKQGRILGKAVGGPVSKGQPYLVGERGPELFTPGASGNIMTASSTRAVMSQGATRSGIGGGGGSAINIYVAGSVIAEKDLVRRVKDEIISLQRRGFVVA